MTTPAPAPWSIELSRGNGYQQRLLLLADSGAAAMVLRGTGLEAWYWSPSTGQRYLPLAVNLEPAEDGAVWLEVSAAAVDGVIPLSSWIQGGEAASHGEEGLGGGDALGGFGVSILTGLPLLGGDADETGVLVLDGGDAAASGESWLAGTAENVESARIWCGTALTRVADDSGYWDLLVMAPDGRRAVVLRGPAALIA